MKILLTVNASWNILNFRRGLVEALLSDGHELTVLAPRDNATDTLIMMGCRHVDLDINASSLNPMGGLKLYRQFLEAFRDFEPDVIFSFTIKNNTFGALAAKKLGIPFVPNVTGLGTAFLSSFLVRFVARNLYRIAFRNLPIVFFQNDDDKALFLKHRLIKASQARRLPGSGVDLEHFQPSSEPRVRGEKFVFLFIGRLIKQKGIHEFTEAAKQLANERSDCEFRVLGDRDAKNRSALSESEFDQIFSNDAIEYLGTTSDVRPVIKGADCVVLPSYREGAPRTLIEAAAMGKALIASDVPGCRDVVVDGINGYLSEPFDAQALANEMTAMLNHTAAELRQMGEESRLHVEKKYDQSIIVAQYRHALKLLAGGDSSSARVGTTHQHQLGYH